MRMFQDRADAGVQLAHALAQYSDKSPVILALPRGGVPVAAEIAQYLAASLDLLLVRKIGVPAFRELAMGAVVEGPSPVVVRNEEIIRRSGISSAVFDEACKRELAEIERRKVALLGGRKRVALEGSVIVIVDDGIATGATVRAAVQAVRKVHPQKLVLAVPVAPAQFVHEIKSEVDAIVCLDPLENLEAVGCSYRDFHQLDDAEVLAILRRFPDPQTGPGLV